MTDNTTVHPASRERAHLVDLFLLEGRPINNDPDRDVLVLVNEGFVVGFSPSRLQPVWAGYRVAGFYGDVGFDRPHLYYEDKRLDPDMRIGPETFGKLDGIQYHVGHMVPNEVINRQFGRLAQMETFFMSNMSPQRGSLNTGVWLRLENLVRQIEDTPDKDHVWAIAGPIFGDDPQTIERPNGKLVPVPEAYFCITADPFRYPWNREGNVDIAWFRIPQDAAAGTPLTEFLSDRASIEADTSLTFFPGWREPQTPPGTRGQPPSVRRTRLRGAPGEPPTPAASDRHRLLKLIS